MATTVLHVDDDPAFLDLSKASFAHLDASVDLTTVTDAEEATSLLTEREFDCVVSDYVTAPDGTAFIETVGERAPETPLILFSGKTLADLPDPSVRSYLSDSLQKGGSGSFSCLIECIREHADVSSVPSMRSAFLKGGTPENTAIRLLDVDDDPTSQLLVALAELRECTVEALPPLFASIDVDLLAALFDHDQSASERVELRFQYAGFDVLVNSDGTAFVRDQTGSLATK